MRRQQLHKSQQRNHFPPRAHLLCDRGLRIDVLIRPARFCHTYVTGAPAGGDRHWNAKYGNGPTRQWQFHGVGAIHPVGHCLPAHTNRYLVQASQHAEARSSARTRIAVQPEPWRANQQDRSAHRDLIKTKQPASKLANVCHNVSCQLSF